MMSRLKVFAAALGLLVASGVGSAVAGNMAMPVQGATSQPVGHYDFCKRYPAECGRNADVALVKMTRTTWSKIVEVNHSVNVTIEPRTDQEVYGVPEYWAYPTTAGDCEDYALLKQYMLERAGFPRSALLITVARQPNGDGHAVLTVRTDRGDFVLDNLAERVLDWKETPYRYLKRQAEANSAKWLSIGDDRDMVVGSVR